MGVGASATDITREGCWREPPQPQLNARPGLGVWCCPECPRDVFELVVRFKPSFQPLDNVVGGPDLGDCWELGLFVERFDDGGRAGRCGRGRGCGSSVGCSIGVSVVPGVAWLHHQHDQRGAAFECAVEGVTVEACTTECFDGCRNLDTC